MDYLVLSGTIWDYLGLSGNIWDYLELFGTIWNYARLSLARVQVEAGESKLLLFGNFSVPLFFTRASYRGACAPKNVYWCILSEWCVKYSIICFPCIFTIQVLYFWINVTGFIHICAVRRLNAQIEISNHHMIFIIHIVFFIASGVNLLSNNTQLVTHSSKWLN